MNKITDIYGLTPMQEGMLFHTILNPTSRNYIEQTSCILKGKLDTDILKKSWQQVSKRYSCLRSAFIWENTDTPLQIIYDEVEIPFDVIDIKELDEKQKENEYTFQKDKELKREFNPANAPLMRIKILKKDEGSVYFIWTNHHILFDGWGMQIVLREVFEVYNSLITGNKIVLNNPGDFKDYITWLGSRDIDSAKEFWTNYLSGFLEHVGIKQQLYDSSVIPLRNEERRLFPSKLTAELLEFCKKNAFTISTLLQAAWSLTLSRYSGKKDIVFGVTTSGRNAPVTGIENMVGLFINTIPFRTRLLFNLDIYEWLSSIQTQQAAARNYEFCPLYLIQKWVLAAEGEPLFNSIMVYENYPVQESINRIRNLITINEIDSFSKTNYPLTVIFNPGTEIALEISYDSALYNPSFIREIMDEIVLSVKKILVNSGKKVDSLIGNINLDNSTNLAELPHVIVHKWFEEIVSAFPDNCAIEFDGKSYSYAEVNSEANIIAECIKNLKVEKEEIIGIYLKKSEKLIYVLLGILKSGCAFLPIDHSYPKERINHILKDSNCKYIITDGDGVEEIASTDKMIIDINSLLERQNYSNKNLDENILGQNNAYIIYTSGSTGKPKGSVLQHEGLCNFIYNIITVFNADSKSRVLQSSSTGFDSFVAEVFLALCTGGTLILMKQSHIFSTDELNSVIREKKITHISVPPSLLSMLNEDGLDDLITVVSVGEKCSWDLAKKWGKTRRFVNGYGPTETTIGALLYIVDQYEEEGYSLPIGKAIKNAEIYLLDELMRPVPFGIAGEIYIGGKGLGRGYLNRPELTAERFLPNPLSSNPGARIYKTGDLAVIHKSGNIEFLDRVDEQIKIRGYRIEINEIEVVLSDFPSINLCKVIMLKDKSGISYLAAFFTAADNIELDELRKYLRIHLPEYMMPSLLKQLEKFPISPNGKIDLSILGNITADEDFTLQKNNTPVEDIIHNIWQQVLHILPADYHSSFFECGGHSLNATQMVSRIKEAFGIEYSLKMFFENPTINGIAKDVREMILHHELKYLPPLKLLPDTGKFMLSFAQKRLWFLEQLAPGNTSFNIPAAIKVKGTLNLPILKKSIDILIERHASLRTYFESTEGTPAQIISSDCLQKFEIINLEGIYDDNKKINELISSIITQPFILNDPPLFKTFILKLSADENILLFIIHHIISDGWSMSILINEINILYNSLINEKAPNLAVNNHKYHEYSEWQNMLLQGEYYDILVNYWKGKLKDASKLLMLPLDKQRPAVKSSNGKSTFIKIPISETERLNELSAESNCTLNMSMLSLLFILLYKLTGEKRICVGTPSAGRDNTEFENIVGFFVNTLVISAEIDGNMGFEDLLQQVRNTMIEAFTYSNMPFEKLVEEVHPERNLSYSPIIQVMFVFQNLPDAHLKFDRAEAEQFLLENNTSDYDITFIVTRGEGYYEIEAEYNSDIFEKNTIDRFLKYYTNIMKVILDNRETMIRNIDLLPETERQQLIYEWNSTSSFYDKQLSFDRQFANIVSENPDHTALLYYSPGENKIIPVKYRELNNYANNVAAELLKVGIKPEERIGICTQKSIEMVASVIGILKCGAIFVPIDPTLPAERINYLIKDSGIKYIILDGISNLEVNEEIIKIIPVLSSQVCDEINLTIDSQNLAYVIYTSGSTGVPKGTMLSHRGLINLANIQKMKFGVEAGTRILQFASLSFDASVWEICMALLNEGVLCIAPASLMKSGKELAELLLNLKINIITLPPSVLSVLPFQAFPDLNVIITAGEPVSKELVNKWGRGRKFFNAYGPTETTVCASIELCETELHKNPSIGKPNSNFALYILDDYLNPAALGVTGELCIDSDSLARGYLNNPQLTADKFRPNNFTEEPGRRIYLTGDNVKYLKDGKIEFLGRKDSQVKVRGFRVEPGEIEENIKQIEGVIDAVVKIIDIDGDKRIAAYYIKSNTLTQKDIKEILAGKLPQYMLPHYLMELDSMPLNSSGKVDRSMLPDPIKSLEKVQKHYTPPITEVEIKLAEIISDLLKIQKISVDDNFFELGGHSLLATQLVSRIRTEFKVDIPLIEIFEHNTIFGMASLIALSEIQTDENIQVKARVRKTVKL